AAQYPRGKFVFGGMQGLAFKPPLACRPSPPQGGRMFAAGPRSRFCVLPVTSFWHAKLEPLIVSPKGNGPAGGSDVYMP
ncbi:hypothetical protein CN199_26540, partial [Sinorhizobium meliloti]